MALASWLSQSGSSSYRWLVCPAVGKLNQRSISDFVEKRAAVHGEYITAVIDSGSNCSLVTKDLMRALNVRYTPNNIIGQLEGSVTSIGHVELPITLNDITHTIKCQVVSSLGWPLLLGLDAGHVFEIHLILKQRKAYVGSDHGAVSQPKIPRKSIYLSEHVLPDTGPKHKTQLVTSNCYFKRKVSHALPEPQAEHQSLRSFSLVNPDSQACERQKVSLSSTHAESNQHDAERICLQKEVQKSQGVKKTKTDKKSNWPSEGK